MFIWKELFKIHSLTLTKTNNLEITFFWYYCKNYKIDRLLINLFENKLFLGIQN